MSISDILSIVAICLSGISIIWNAISYYKYDKKLKTLDIKGKEIEIQKYQKEKEDEKKAVIKGEFIFKGEGKYYHFSVTNNGKCEARNITIRLPKEQIEAIDTIQTIEYLSPNQSLLLRVQPTYSCKRFVNVEFQWDDDFDKCRHSIEHVVVPHVIVRNFN
ncbi:MAG: hypothetical protein ACSW8I_02195 [bacterium]